jgi:glycosyltransferase involved in cell wall biosynthesis
MDVHVRVEDDEVLRGPRVSFLICTRNRAVTVYECVLEMLKSPRFDFEIIVRDNCSDDNTVGLLRSIVDRRLIIDVAPENQGTRTFYEVSRLARGELVTWLSDEDSFQFAELDFVVEQFRRHPSCNALFGGIIVGERRRRVLFLEDMNLDVTQGLITSVSFSGCGGVFLRNSALKAADLFDVVTGDDAYALWNYYPIGFFASRCMARSVATTSRVIVVQSRFAPTTNNWSKLSSAGTARLPHYYPESVVDRLASNIVNVFSRSLPLGLKIRIAIRLVRLFRAQIPSFASAAFHQLLHENYTADTVEEFNNHVERLGLNTAAGRQLWFIREVVFSLPTKLAETRRHWRRLQSSKVS